jgi:hypothetical protein
VTEPVDWEKLDLEDQREQAERAKLQALEAELKRVTDENTALMNQLRAMPDDISVVKMWVQTLLDIVVGASGTAARLQYEIALQAKVREVLEQSASQITRSRLLEGVNLANGNGRPG